MSQVIRWGAYPIIFGSCALLQILIVTLNWPYWPLAPLIAGIGITSVALLERIQPYEAVWNKDHDDTFTDILHAMFSLTLIFTSLEISRMATTLLQLPLIWPSNWPIWVDVIIVGFILDFGLWFMHWLSHKNNFLWRLHTIHHSPERIYWLNGERRHPLSALALALPGVVVAILLGAPPEAIGCWFSIISVHLAFQHANLDYSVGIFRKLLGVAEIHRWHHKREYEDAQVNFGEFWLIWDQLFGTYHDQGKEIRAGEIGLNSPLPNQYFKQLVWPFKKEND